MLSNMAKHAVLFPLWMLLLFLVPVQINARSWTDVEVVHDLMNLAEDPTGPEYLWLKELQLMDENYTPPVDDVIVDRSPSTNAPSPMPSSSPTTLPSQLPSESPTLFPSQIPSVPPSQIPSGSPSLDPFPPVESPRNPETGYFNYDDSSTYGPGNWGSVKTPNNFYWEEFDDNGFGAWDGYLAKRDPSKNICETGDRQSPIDLKESGATCHEFHEIRDRSGDYPVTDRDIEKRIESNKLRLHYPRRPCVKCNSEPDPPDADFPYGWGDVADVVHIDLKIPSEHTIMGERFEAEFIINHVHPDRKRVAALTTLIRAQPDGYNYYFQEALNAFQEQYDDNRKACRRRKMEERVGNSTTPAMDEPSAAFSSPTPTAAPILSMAPSVGWNDYSDFNISAAGRKSGTFKRGSVWDPYHPMLIPTIHFWHYEGSITEPPCFEGVSWWVSDKPMVIGWEQLQQMKRILFTNVDSQCRLTSVHSGHSVARPIQKSNGRDVYICTPDDFGPDK